MVEASDAGRPAAAKMRTTRPAERDRALRPGGVEAMQELLDRRRPWVDEPAVARELREWAERYWPPRRGIALGTVDIARYLRGIATDPDLDGDTARGVTLAMLRNVWAGRDFLRSDPLGDVVKGWPATTMNRYRRLYGQDALHTFLTDRVQREQDQVALMRAGRTRSAARRYLELHPRTPGMGYYPAPPARARRAK
jgi:hypothetical protein